MGHLRRPGNLPRTVIDERQASDFAAGVDLDPQWLRIRVGYRTLENNGEGMAPPDSGFPVAEEPPRPRRMTRTERPVLGVYDQDHGYLPFRVCPRLRG
jgi:hypothetical protein